MTHALLHSTYALIAQVLLSRRKLEPRLKNRHPEWQHTALELRHKLELLQIHPCTSHPADARKVLPKTELQSFQTQRGAWCLQL
jgi:hypothetical protein